MSKFTTWNLLGNYTRYVTTNDPVFAFTGWNDDGPYAASPTLAAQKQIDFMTTRPLTIDDLVITFEEAPGQFYPSLNPQYRSIMCGISYLAENWTPYLGDPWWVTQDIAAGLVANEGNPTDYPGLESLQLLCILNNTPSATITSVSEVTGVTAYEGDGFYPIGGDVTVYDVHGTVNTTTYVRTRTLGGLEDTQDFTVPKTALPFLIQVNEFADTATTVTPSPDAVDLDVVESSYTGASAWGFRFPDGLPNGTLCYKLFVTPYVTFGTDGGPPTSAGGTSQRMYQSVLIPASSSDPSLFELALNNDGKWYPQPGDTTHPLKYNGGVSIVKVMFGVSNDRFGVIRPSKDGGFLIYETSDSNIANAIGLIRVFRHDRTLSAVITHDLLPVYIPRT